MLAPILPSVLYEEKVKAGELFRDSEQETHLPAMDTFAQSFCAYHAALAAQPTSSGGMLAYLNSTIGFGRWGRSAEQVMPHSLYLYGTVGRGKTAMMMLLMQCLPKDSYLFMHFNQFMDKVHSELAQVKGQDPLKRVAKQLVGDKKCLIFDEFLVEEIADAMVLSRLLRVLFEELGVCILTSSNTAIDNLYAEGLHRARFFPAIALLNEQCHQLDFLAQQDYRSTALQTERYLYPNTLAHREQIINLFLKVAGISSCQAGTVEVLSRPVGYLAATHDMFLFTFEQLCGAGRSYRDYVYLAEIASVIAIVDVPEITAESDFQARRFTAFIDEMYVNGIVVLVHAALAPARLYTGIRLQSAFERTASRLIEMQSNSWIKSKKQSLIV